MKTVNTFTQHGSTNFLRATIIVMGLIILLICAFVLPSGIASDKTDYYRPLLLGLYVPAIPYFIALGQALKLLDYIDKNEAFSALSVTALKKIKYCALTISGLFILGQPYIYYVADRDDAPGVVAIGLIITGASIVIATFAAVLQKLLQTGMDIKNENDLTV